jgi:hypothetical protein
MRNFSNFIIQELQKEAISAFIVVNLDLSTPQQWTTLPYDVEIDDQLYTGKAKLLSFDLPRADQAVGRDSYKIIVSDPNRDLESTLLQSGFGALMRIRLGMLDEYTPQLTDLVEVYNGSIDTWSFEQGDEGRALTVQGVSPSGALNYTRAIYTDKDYVQQQNFLDSSMNAIGSASAESLTMGWGRAPS